MQIEINEENIDKYGLAQLTGNTREDMLSRAAEAHENGYTLNAQIPDDLLHTNIFDAVESTPVDQAEVGQSQCTYGQEWTDEAGYVWVCKLHGMNSKHDIVAGSHRPCLAMDPY